MAQVNLGTLHVSHTQFENHNLLIIFMSNLFQLMILQPFFFCFCVLFYRCFELIRNNSNSVSRMKHGATEDEKKEEETEIVEEKKRFIKPRNTVRYKTIEFFDVVVVWCGVCVYCRRSTKYHIRWSDSMEIETNERKRKNMRNSGF